jgi:CHC2 zinc finger
LAASASETGGNIKTAGGCPVNDYSDLREKIDEAKWQLPLPALMAKLGLVEHAEKSAHCPFAGHEDKHPSFSVFQSSQGKGWQWKCFAGCGEGDEIAFLRKLKGLSATQAISFYLDIAGFPPVTHNRSKSREWLESPNSHGCPESPKSPVSPVSKGQELEKELGGLAVRNACTRVGDDAESKLFKCVRDVRGLEKRIGRKLTTAERTLVFDEWYYLSQGFLDAGKSREDYLAEFFRKLGKVRVPTGDGDTLNKAVTAVSKLSGPKLPVIPGMSDAPESWRRVLGLHREMSRRSTRKDKTYFLSCRDTAKAFPGLRHQQAYNINLALVELDVIEIVRLGDKREGGKATEFRIR